MPFFDNIGKRISDAGQNVAKQTKNLADITQLNSAISERQKGIQQLYLSLGQAYYETHKNDPAAEESEKIRQINTLFCEIAQCRDKIAQIRSSNASIARAEQPVPTQIEEEGNLCPKCGAAVMEGNLFCNQCGSKL